MEEKLISIIIPVYNTEKYLEKCIKSVLNQSIKNIEVILIDDGSTDGSGIICDKYAKIDNRIIVIHQENKGVSTARNAGIQKSTGEYIGFVDADDYIESNMFEILCNNINNCNSDIVICNYNLIKKNKVQGKNFRNIKEIITREKFLYNMANNTFNGFLWNKLYKKSIILKNNLKLDEKISYCEDFVFNVEYSQFVNKASVVNYRLYNYVQRKESVVNRAFSSKRLDVLNSYNKIIDKLKNYNTSIVRKYEILYTEEAIRLENLYLKSKYRNEYDYKIIKDAKRKYFKKVIFYKNLTLKQRIKFYIIYFFPYIGIIIKK